MESPAKLTLCLRSPLQQRDRNKDTGGCFSLFTGNTAWQIGTEPGRQEHSLADRNTARQTGTEPGRQELNPEDGNTAQLLAR